MATQRVSLSNSALQGRIKKYDRYEDRAGRMLRSSDGVAKLPTVAPVKPASPPTTSSGLSLKNQPRLTRVNGNSHSKPTSKYIKQAATTKKHLAQQPFPRTAQKESKVSMALAAVAEAKEERTQEGVFVTQFSDGLEPFYGAAKKGVSRLQRLMYGLGIVVFLVAGAASLQSLLVNQQAQEQIKTLGIRTDEQGVSEGTGNDPAEDPIPEDAVNNYQVAPEDPRYLRIPQLQVFARIKGLGLNDTGAIDAPWNIHDVGWYNKAARPGAKKGTSLLLGHVSGWTGPGVFKRISELQTGAQFEVEKGSGEIIHYEVTRSEEMPLEQVNMAHVLDTDIPGEHDLKLMTCSGSYNRDSETYEDRFIVYAKQIE